ncbi:MAG: AAA family ATPase [Hydrogenophaga sp.]|uniref:ATP-binding protein n=1 Tax=Hydrogenophaga sp. TaxID=1904254 RepID=UPI00271A3A16|nr:AAA family ATPase [Hydrogenophaga sp.]MDO9480859.1 AAA family ATPase [Hydrogenophaga sp.]MDO9568599.1 AAA family ATPase [Hydrogenophaga sp.]MDP3375273.1 AAA family ATPase [Hydrogenophaga sp.]MDP3808981.1 AAA family ATPase [Hydrogenophaga sp.]MDP3926356.1 AAA family ATPase [Hydrogenophaga sp.]
MATRSRPADPARLAPASRTAQRLPAEQLYADELAHLAVHDTLTRPPGWQLSMPAVRSFILGGSVAGQTLRRKMVCAPSLIERSLVTLASQRALLLVGEPGTAKSLLSELLAAAVCGTSTLTVQGSAATTEDHIRYGWNYALLLNQGPSVQALVPSPLLRAMQNGQIARFEEITRCPPEVQDALLSVLSERLLTVPELPAHDTVFAQPGFNLIATANTRDRGVNEMSAALKRRFAFETVLPIADHVSELALVYSEVTRLLAQGGVPVTPNEPLLEVLVTTFRDLRQGVDQEGGATDRLSSVLSTAEAVSVAHAVTLRGHYLRGDNGQPSDLVEALVGTAAKDNADDLKKLRRYIEHRAAKRTGEHWVAFHAARHALPQ